MKHFYCISALVASFGLILAGMLHKYPHLLNGRIGDLLGFTAMQWLFIAAPVLLLCYPNGGRK